MDTPTATRERIFGRYGFLFLVLPPLVVTMAETRFDVLCIGNAIVDVLARVEDSFLARHDLTKGMMRLIDEQTADQLYGDMGPAIEISGGSAGNTAAGLASFGGRAAYFGKVKNDQLGDVFSARFASTRRELLNPCARRQVRRRRAVSSSSRPTASAR